MIKTFQCESVAIKSDEVAQSMLRSVCALEKHNWEARREQKLSLLTEVVSKHLDTWMTVTASLQNCSVLNSLDALSRNFLLRTVTAVVWASHPCKRSCDGGGVTCQTSSDVQACQKIGWNHALCYSLAPWRTEFRLFKPVTGIQKYSHAESVPGDMAGHFIFLWILYFIYQCFEYYLSHKTPFTSTPSFYETWLMFFDRNI